MDYIEITLRLLVALSAGLLLGVERTVAHKVAGMRTYSLVALGAALFTITSQIVSEQFFGMTQFDPLRVASQIVVGTGFMGAGLVVFKDTRITGLTTAVGMWVAAGLGMAAGFGLYEIVGIATVLTIFVFTVLWSLEQWITGFVDPETPDSHVE